MSIPRRKKNSNLSHLGINLFAFWGIQIPLAYLLAKAMSLGPIGVYLSIIIAESILAITAIFIFRRGKWKKVVV